MTNDAASPGGIRVFLADPRPLENQLLAGALLHNGFDVVSVLPGADPVLAILGHGPVDVAVVGCSIEDSARPDMTFLRALHSSYPQVPKMVLIETDDRDTIVQAFRAGGRGIFCLAESSFSVLCEGILRVHGGDIWANTRQLNYLLDSVCQVPAVRVVSADGQNLLTFREEQVVALVADGLSNRDVATELGLSEHTVKKYLFRIFEKLGISNRVELVLYTFHHGAPQTASWAAQA